MISKPSLPPQILLFLNVEYSLLFYGHVMETIAFSFSGCGAAPVQFVLDPGFNS